MDFDSLCVWRGGGFESVASAQYTICYLNLII